MFTFNLLPKTTAAVLSAAALLAACSGAPDGSGGIREPAGTVTDAAKDLAITSEVKTRLARDSELRALDIHVQTKEGRALLRGSAPDTDSRNRAAELAQGVAGVVGVQNDLSVQVLAK